MICPNYLLLKNGDTSQDVYFCHKECRKGRAISNFNERPFSEEIRYMCRIFR